MPNVLSKTLAMSVAAQRTQLIIFLLHVHAGDVAGAVRGILLACGCSFPENPRKQVGNMRVVGISSASLTVSYQ